MADFFIDAVRRVGVVGRYNTPAIAEPPPGPDAVVWYLPTRPTLRKTGCIASNYSIKTTRPLDKMTYVCSTTAPSCC